MHKRILIVDDDEQILDLLQLSLKVWCPDCYVVLATNGREALKQIRRHQQPFHLIVTDYDMPMMNGLDLAQTVRENWPDIRIVLMTGQLDRLNLHKEPNFVGFDGYIRKPFMMKQVKGIFLDDSEIFH